MVLPKLGENCWTTNHCQLSISNAEYRHKMHRVEQSSSSGLLDGGADENRELGYPSLAQIRIEAQWIAQNYLISAMRRSMLGLEPHTVENNGNLWILPEAIIK
jgi:hypothetical protein